MTMLEKAMEEVAEEAAKKGYIFQTGVQEMCVRAVLRAIRDFPMEKAECLGVNHCISYFQTTIDAILEEKT